MTERLYYADAYLRQWNAVIVERRGLQIALDRSAFYPEGGGQPADHGTINGVRVVDVQSDDAGMVWHTLDGEITTAHVACALDWTRRFDHMQQHHGQHLLSAAFDQLYAMRTVAFHLSASSVTIDLDTPTITPEQLAAVEDLTNQMIWADLPIMARFVEPAELATIKLRKPPSVTGAIRVVSAGDFDHSACGGTHPRSTGSVGSLIIRRTERRGATTRVEFLCGGRALQLARWNNALINRVASNFSGSPEQLETSIERLRTNEATTRKALQTANEQLLDYEAQALVRDSNVHHELRIVRMVWENREANDVRTLAQLVAKHGGLALFGLRGTKPQLMFAGETSVDCGALLRETVAQFGGKGGGSRTQAQGGIANNEDLEQALDFARGKLD